MTRINLYMFRHGLPKHVGINICHKLYFITCISWLY